MIQILCHLWGDYILQSDWIAQNKTKRNWPALVHALTYSLCFVPLIWFHGRIPLAAWVCWGWIFGTHFLIDRYRLARYVVWAKNWLGPWSRMESVGEAVERMKASGELPRPVILPGQKIEIVPRLIRFIVPLSECPTGYPPSTPIWLSTWLLIIADNTLHMTINYLALRYL